MTSETFWHLQSALYSKLSANTALCGRLAAGSAGIYDDVPRDAAFPYIVIGDMSSLPEDTQDSRAEDVRMTLHVYSRSGGQRECKRIIDAAADALEDGALNIAGHVAVLCRRLSVSCALMADGETRQGLMEYRLIVERVI
jgi:hypothetical protein